MKTPLIPNDAPNGSERTSNGARLAGAVAKQAQNEVKVFLISDAVAAAHMKQKVPAGIYYHEVMLGSVVNHNGVISVYGTCLDAQGIAAEDFIPGAYRGSLDELTQSSAWADKVLVF